MLNRELHFLASERSRAQTERDTRAHGFVRTGTRPLLDLESVRTDACQSLLLPTAEEMSFISGRICKIFMDLYGLEGCY
jgi:hypothetical protein